MYNYTEIDKNLVHQRVAQFRDQVNRYFAGNLSEEHFRPLRLQNGLYLQRHAPMLRIAIPYGTLSTTQLNMLAHVCDTYDRGYGHFTTRQNIQLNWPQLERIPDLLEELAEVGMHAMQTSGNCIRNITSDPLAGCVGNEVIDPRIICELIRQWATLHPEFAYLPRKFKIAVIATPTDRAAIEVHDIGIRLQAGENSDNLCFDLYVGGGLGRTPYIGQKLFTKLPIAELRNYLQAVLRVYNVAGRRDNKYKARIKILVNALGIDAFREKVLHSLQTEYEQSLVLHSQEIATCAARFTPNQHALVATSGSLAQVQKTHQLDSAFVRWLDNSYVEHKMAGYCLVYVSLKRPGIAAGDLASDAMRVLAKLAEKYSLGELRVTHDQNLVLPYVRYNDCYNLYQELNTVGLAHPNKGLVTDAIACPGIDFCSLANAPVIALADELHKEFPELDEQLSIGPIEIKMSGCMNACGHHHIGNIGILGVDKKGEFWYQITLGGRDRAGATLGEKIGPSIPLAEVSSVIRKIVDCYLTIRQQGEIFADAITRVGIAPFKEVVYAVDKN